MLKASETTSEVITNDQPLNNDLHPRLQTVIAFERTCGTVSSSMGDSLILGLFIHTFLGYLLLAKHPFSDFAIQLMQVMKRKGLPYSALQTCGYLLNLILLGSLAAADQRHKSRIWYSSVKRVVSLYGFLCNVTLKLTSFLLYCNLEGNVLLMGITMLVNLFNTVVFSNFHVKKEENYQTSQTASLLLLLLALLQPVANSIIYQYSTLMVYCSVAAGFSMLFFLWQLISGYKLYLHLASRRVHLVLSTIYISTGLIYLLLIRGGEPLRNFSFFNLGIATLSVGCFLHFN